MVINLRKSIHWLILLGVILTPLFSIGEMLALLRGLVQSLAFAYTPTYIKGLKDLLLIVIASLSLLAIGTSGKTNRLAIPFLILMLYIAAVAMPALLVDPRLPVAGVRWILPVFLSFLLIRHVDELLLKRIAFVLALMLLAHFGAQLLQLFFMSNWYGVNIFGLAARVPGIFFIPSTASFFAILCLYFAVFHLPRRWPRRAVYAIVPVSVFLTQSGTGVMVLVAFGALLALGPRKALLLVPVAPLFALLMLAALPVLTGRESTYVQVSGGTRLGILVDLISRGELLPSLFGYATNTAVLVSSGSPAGPASEGLWMIADSTYASVIGNLGLLGLGMLLLLGIVWSVLLLNQKRLDLYAFTLIFSLFGFTVIIMEAFPMNLLFAVLTAYYLRTAYLPRPAADQPASWTDDERRLMAT